MTTSKTSEFGTLAEKYASEFLQSRNYTILALNYSKPWGEIDIIAEKEKVLVFVEVKTMAAVSSGDALTPEDQMTSAKLRKFRRVAQMFAASHPDLIRERTGWRMDLVTVSIPRKATGDFDINNPVIGHYENV